MTYASLIKRFKSSNSKLELSELFVLHAYLSEKKCTNSSELNFLKRLLSSQIANDIIYLNL